jgi:hypothetical protein
MHTGAAWCFSVVLLLLCLLLVKHLVTLFMTPPTPAQHGGGE